MKGLESLLLWKQHHSLTHSLKNPMKFLLHCLALAIVALFFSGCASVPVTPNSIEKVKGRDVEKADALTRWNEAVLICNAFLHSTFRKTLPEGETVLDGNGMTFVTATGRLPIHVRCCSAGDLLIPFNMVAQERSDGFVVGKVQPKKNRELDNTLFNNLSEKALKDYQISGLVLHELTHTYFRQGTVSFSKTIAYYAEAIFLFRYRSHSMEKQAFQTSNEFRAFVKARVDAQKARDARVSATGPESVSGESASGESAPAK
jgi:hypothetical protein